MRKYGWKKDTVDERDFKFCLTKPVEAPVLVDLEETCPPVYDQGNSSSCTANGIAAGIEFDQIKQKLPVFTPSRLFIYYNERELEGDPNEDAGAQIRDGIKLVNTIGVCPETLWPFDESKITTKPLLECYVQAKAHPTVSYHRVNQDSNSLEQVLASGFPIVFGFTVFESFEGAEVAKTGILGMPSRHEQYCGGHAVLCVGYDRAKQMVKVRNSWGASWGQRGYFWMPYEYISNPNLADDFWVIQTVK